MGPTLAGIVIGFVALSLLFGTAERVWPAVRGQKRWRRGTGTDLAYWFFTPLVTKALTRGSVIAALVVLALLAGVRLEAESLRQFAQGSGSWVQRQPVWLQIVEVLLLGDLLGYASHRFFHGRRLWRFHAVHHSSRDVDWLSAVRLHPINDVVSRLFQVVPFLLLGFPPTLLAAYAPFLTLYAIGLHANVPWTFGPLRYVLASPAFHRWHHTSEAEGLDRNFAGLFPFLDLAFGTFYMPKDRQPAGYHHPTQKTPERFRDFPTHLVEEIFARPSAMDERERKRGWSLTKPAFDKLMARMESAAEAPGDRYLRARRNLVRFFEGRRSRLAEEQADETLNRVARRLDEGAEIQNFEAYLYGVARLVMLEAIDERARERKAFSEVPLRLVQPGQAEGEETGARLDCLSRCLERLPPDGRALIVQYYQGERRAKIENRQKLAISLGIPLQALRARALRLREKLEACVSACLGRRPSAA